jgi:hypothetical protein
MQDKIPLKVKHDQLMAWIDLPFDERPQLLMGAFRSVIEMSFSLNSWILSVRTVP